MPKRGTKTRTECSVSRPFGNTADGANKAATPKAVFFVQRALVDIICRGLLLVRKTKSE